MFPISMKGGMMDFFDTNNCAMFTGALLLFAGVVMTILSNYSIFKDFGPMGLFLLLFGPLTFLNGFTMKMVMSDQISTLVVVLHFLQFPLVILCLFALVKVLKHGFGQGLLLKQ